MMAFTSVVEPLRAANLLAGRPLYRWTVISEDGKPILPSSGIGVMAGASIRDKQALDAVVVCTGGEAHSFDRPRVFGWLRRVARGGAHMGAVADGSFLLARAGLLDGYRCTVHWQGQPAFAESFPGVDLSRDLYVIDRTRFTCAGGTGAFDMMLEIIGRTHGETLALRVAEWFVHDHVRADADRNRLPLQLRTGINHPTVLKAIGLMDEHKEEPLTARRLAALSGISSATLERLFRAHTGRRPMTYYRQLRLRHAYLLLHGSTLPVGEVALACGFASPAHFARCYRAVFRETPSETRQRRSSAPSHLL